MTAPLDRDIARPGTRIGLAGVRHQVRHEVRHDLIHGVSMQVRASATRDGRRDGVPEEPERDNTAKALTEGP